MNPPLANGIARTPIGEFDRVEFRDIYFDRLNPQANTGDFLDAIEVASQILEVRNAKTTVRTR